jgi:hypothetical protein
VLVVVNGVLMTPRKIVALFVGIEILIIALVLLREGYSLSSLQTITRFSERLSLFLFSAIFLFYTKPSISAWLSNRFYLLFAIVHTIHLAELLLFVYLSGSRLIPIRTAGGFLAYVYIFSMPILQQLKAKGLIVARSFSILEIVFVYCIWLNFFLTYLPRVQGRLPLSGDSFAEHVALLGWISTMLGMKLTGLIQFKNRKRN